jgi:small subunit ribosomal protein S16
LYYKIKFAEVTVADGDNIHHALPARLFKEKNMAVKIRLTRMGKKKKPFYRIVAANSEAPRDGKFLDVVGTYDPLQKPAAITLNKEKLQHWLDRGATPSTTVKSIIAQVAAE